MTAMVRYAEGFVLKLSSTASNGHPGPILTFYGTEGTLEYNGRSFTLVLPSRAPRASATPCTRGRTRRWRSSGS